MRSSSPRIMRIGVPVRRHTKKLPTVGSWSVWPAYSQPRLKRASRSSVKNSGSQYRPPGMSGNVGKPTGAAFLARSKATCSFQRSIVLRPRWHYTQALLGNQVDDFPSVQSDDLLRCVWVQPDQKTNHGLDRHYLI